MVSFFPVLQEEEAQSSQTLSTHEATETTILVHSLLTVILLMHIHHSLRPRDYQLVIHPALYSPEIQ